MTLASAFELGDHQHVAGLKPIEQAGWPRPPAGDGLGNDAPLLDLEAGGDDLLQLVIGTLGICPLPRNHPLGRAAPSEV